MAEAIDWMQYADQPNKDAQNTDWMQYAEPADKQKQLQNAKNPEEILQILGLQARKPSPYKAADYFNVADSTDTFKNAWEDLFRREGVHGGNREFAKIFGHGQHQQDTQKAYERAMETHPEETQLGGNLARGYSTIPFFMAAGGVPGMQALNPAVQNIAAAGIGGGALGSIETPYGEETRAGNAFNQAKQDAIAASLFEALRFGGKALNGEYKPELPTFMSQNKVGAEVGGDAKALANELSAAYEEVKAASKQAGIKANTKQTVTEPLESGILDPTGKPMTRQVSKAPSIKQIKKELPGVDDSVHRTVHNALETGDIGDLIDAEKALGQFKHRQWMNQQRNLKAIDQNAYDAATSYENKINNYMSEALDKNAPGLADKLFGARNKYHVELGPYLDVPAIREYMHGNLTEKDMVRLLQSNTKSGTQFRAKLADKYKAVGQNKFKNDLGKMGLKATRIGEILLLIGGV